MKLHACCLLVPAFALLTLSSCVDPSMSGGGYAGSNNGGFHTYAKLPPNHRGSAYYHQGRYYTGGQHQTGSYNYQGKKYTSRYSHNGQYYYGGQHQNSPRENHEFQRGNFPAGNYPDGNYQGTSWNSPNGN